MNIIIIIYNILYIYEIIIFISFILEFILKINPYILKYRIIDIFRTLLLKFTYPVINVIKKIINTEYKLFDFSYIILILFIETIKNIILLIIR